MIVEVGFLDHWKTRMLVGVLGKESAPLCVIRLWEFCQTRKTAKMKGLTPDALKAICRWDGDGNLLLEALVQCGFLEISGDVWVAHDWEKINASLVHSWKNGKKGGRPKKPSNNPTETGRKPNNNPAITQPKPDENPTKPSNNPTETDREEKIREDKIDKIDKRRGDQRRRGVPKGELSEEAVRFVRWFAGLVPERLKPKVKGYERRWGEVYERLKGLGYGREVIARAVRWARADAFWSGQFYSPLKLLKTNDVGVRYVDLFLEKSAGRGNGAMPVMDSTERPMAEVLAQREGLSVEEWEQKHAAEQASYTDEVVA